MCLCGELISTKRKHTTVHILSIPTKMMHRGCIQHLNMIYFSQTHSN